MRARIPLSSRILFIAIVNALLVCALLLAIARFEFGVGVRSFLFAPARDRTLAVARDVALDLEQTPADARTSLMARYAHEYGADFFLFKNDGRQLGGRPITLPEEVRAALTRGGPPDGRPPPPPPREGGPPPRERDRIDLFESSAEGLYWVGARIPVPIDNDVPLRGTLIIAARSFYGTPLFFNFKPWLAAIGALIAIFLVCWFPFIRGLTKTISQVTRATELIAEGQFTHRLPESRGDELGQLSIAINRMAERLAGFVTGQKRFLGDIAHELCAPIARMQFGLGILEQQAEEGQHAAVEDVQDEMRLMSSLVNELLSFSKAGMESKTRTLAPVDVEATARDAVAREALDGADAVSIEITGPLLAMADREFLLRSLSNLIRNAVRYAGAAGAVRVAGRRENGDVVVSVIDSGPGVPQEEIDKVFAPFYRVETSRNRETGGAGLGLAIVKSCVEACGGTVQCRNRKPIGFEVEIRLKALQA
ncbi:MAG TPA: HAMP domain-containing sensor histidine kinase [Bryobacteraceae bacterium]|nr:HAMP domain-containing sensor histidine kinase [Bryobacteraceae bacterium]